MNRAALEQELKGILVDSLMLDDRTAAAIDRDKPLFGGGGVGLDSIDALELGMAISKRYGIEIDSSDDRIRQAFRTIGTLAEFVETHREPSK
jgi:acyl carrier protein